jgi:GNAT superfamily N-acetyltransferase
MCDRRDVITYRDSHDVDLEQLGHLFVTAGWPHRARDPAKLARLIANSMYVVSAWDGERLVGFARAISDGVSNAYVSTVAVLPEWRRRGIGRECMRRLVEGDGKEGIRWVLHARAEVHRFYRESGFEPADNMLRRERLSH